MRCPIIQMLVLALILPLARGYGAEGGGSHDVPAPVSVTTFILKDGTKIRGTSWSSLGERDLKSYLIETLEGRRLIVLGKELASRTEELVPLDKLPEKARAEVLKARAAAAAARAEAEAAERDERLVAGQRRKENEIRMQLKMVLDETALAQTVLDNAAQIVSSAPVEIARLDAQYDAAKTELGGNAYVADFLGGPARDTRRSDYLRDQMVAAAEDKARVEQSRKEAQGVAARTKASLKQLEARAAGLRKDLDAAEAETAAALKQAREAAGDRQQARQQELQKRERQAPPAPVQPAAAPPPRHEGSLEIRPAAATPAVPTESTTVLTLKNGTRIRAATILEDPDGRMAVKDVAGKVLYLDAKDVAKREK